MRIPEKRRIDIRNLIQQEKTVSVEKIAKLFNISPVTVRRDLEKLQDRADKALDIKIVEKIKKSGVKLTLV